MIIGAGVVYVFCECNSGNPAAVESTSVSRTQAALPSMSMCKFLSGAGDAGRGGDVESLESQESMYYKKKSVHSTLIDTRNARWSGGEEARRRLKPNRTHTTLTLWRQARTRENTLPHKVKDGGFH